MAGFWTARAFARSVLRDEQCASAAVASLHGTGIAAGAIVRGLGFPWLAQRYGRGRTL